MSIAEDSVRASRGESGFGGGRMLPGDGCGSVTDSADSCEATGLIGYNSRLVSTTRRNGEVAGSQALVGRWSEEIPIPEEMWRPS